ncbi:MAG: N-acetylmuramoyl-L-alanine amidase [Rhodothermaceae bacterium]|nr:N-acetylmuramoyl-L-alanine amidase [Rhodothermaceae bacterium]
MLLGATVARADADLERISFTARSDGQGYVVRIHAEGRVAAYTVEENGEGAIDLIIYRAQLATNFRRDAAEGPVQSYRVVPSDGRVVVTFALRSGITVEPQAYPDRDSDDLLLALTVGSSNASPPVAQTGTGAGADAASREHWRLDCVVIDAGHGGHDGGATYNGVREKDVTLGIARRLGGYIEDRLGVRVVYTRSDDRFIELHERGRIANDSCGKLFVSIHANAAGSRSAHGTETYFLAPHRTESAREVMARENAVVRLESDPNLYDDFDAEGGIVRALTMSAYQQESQELASMIQQQFGQRAGRRNRGVKQAGFLVLWRASMPAVLIETGFVSNRDEARFLASAQGQDLIASAIFRAVRDYKARYERGLRLTAGS